MDNMDNGPRRFPQPDCVRGIETRSVRCRNAGISFYFREDSFITMTTIDIGYMEYRARENVYAVRVDVSPITVVTDIVVAMDPLLDYMDPILPFDQVIFATEAPNPDGEGRHERELSRFPRYVVLISSEATSDLLMEGLSNAEIFGVNCNPVRIGPRYSPPQVPLLGYPPVPVGRQIENPDDMIMNLRECCPPRRHEQLARIMENPNMCTELVIEMLYEALFPQEPDPDWD